MPERVRFEDCRRVEVLEGIAMPDETDDIVEESPAEPEPPGEASSDWGI